MAAYFSREPSGKNHDTNSSRQTLGLAFVDFCRKPPLENDPLGPAKRGEPHHSSTSTSTMTMRMFSAFILLLAPLSAAFSPPSFGGRPIFSSTALKQVSSLSTATGEADRSFRLGLQLEKAGLARAASAAFHEAATLYQCFLDSETKENGDDDASNVFQHVTTLAPDSSSSPNVPAILAYACIRLAHLSHDAFGDSKAATRLYKLAKKIDPMPSGVAFHGIGTSIEASMDYFGSRSAVTRDEESFWRDEMEKAVEAYKGVLLFD
jgi:hypothetical protein